MLSYTNASDYVMPFFTTAGGLQVNKPGLDFFFKKTQLPWIGEVDISDFVTDPDLKKLEYAVIKDTYAHRFESFYKDNVSTSSSKLFVAVIMGEGPTITVPKDEEAKKIIDNWNDEINVRHDTIEDLIGTIWDDNLINKEHLSRIFINKQDPIHKVDIQRISMKSVRTEIHETYGWRRWIQTANIPAQSMTKNTFYRGDSITMLDKVPVQVIIPDEPQCAFYVSLFKTPPVSTVLPQLVYKRWIMWFMRKFAEKFWAPFLLAYVGDPQNGFMPQRKEDKDEAIINALNALKKVRSYGVGSFLATTKVDVLDTKVGKNSNIYVDYLEHLNKEIALGLMTSISLREGERQRAQNSSIVEQGILRYIRGVRNTIGTKLRKLYSDVVLPAYDKEGFKPTDIKVDWPPLRMDNIRDLLQAVEIAAKIGAFKDEREIRKILNPLWKHIDEKISDEDAKKMWKTFIEMNSPSRAMGDAPQSRTQGNTKQ